MIRPLVNHGTVGCAEMMMNDTQNNLGKSGLAYLLNVNMLDLSVGNRTTLNSYIIVLK